MTPAGLSPSAESRRFLGFLEADWEQWLREYPAIATTVGYPGLDDRWTDDSPEAIEGRRRHLAQSLTAVQGFRRSRLDPDDRLHLDLYLELLESTVAGLEFGLDPFPFRFGMPRDLRMPISQMEGIHITASEALGLQPHGSLAEFEAHVRRLEALPRAIDQQIALLERGRTSGFTPTRVAVRGVPDQVRGLFPDDPLKSALLEAFAELPATIPEADRAGLRREAFRAYSEEVAPALRRLHEYLVARYLPACRASVGVSAVSKGSELYRHLIRWQTTTDLTAKEIHEKGLSEVRRLRAEIDAIRVRTGFVGDYAAFLEFLRSDRRFFFATGEQLVDGYRVIAKKTDPTLARLFGTLPRLPYGVLPVPEFRAKSSPAAYYIPGAPDSGRAGYFYANTNEVGARPRWEMEALAFHEAVPGHHLQIALASERSSLPAFRRYSAYTAFVEGWGLYAESLGDELGFYRDPYSKVGQLTYDTWRSARLVVDTGMHAMGWTRDQAIQFFRENTGKSEVDIAVEVDRYIVWPGQALAYKVGQLKFRELRTRAERRLGTGFDVRAFHDLVLGEGALPLGEVERRVDAWIASRVGRKETRVRARRGPTPRRRASGGPVRHRSTARKRR